MNKSRRKAAFVFKDYLWVADPRQVTFLWTSKEESPRVQGRSHPPLGFEIARKARETFKTWISAFAEMTAVCSVGYG